MAGREILATLITEDTAYRQSDAVLVIVCIPYLLIQYLDFLEEMDLD